VGGVAYDVLTNFRMESARDNLCVKLVPISLKIYANIWPSLTSNRLISRVGFLPRPNFFVSHKPQYQYYETYDDAK
jgi:hypothetical protein